MIVKIIGLPTPKLSQMIDGALLREARVVTADSDHALHSYFQVLPSGRRDRCTNCSRTGVLCLRRSCRAGNIGVYWFGILMTAVGAVFLLGPGTFLYVISLL